MPQIRIEFTPGTTEPLAVRALAVRLHHALAPVLGADLESFKTRVVPLEGFVVGAGETAEGFVHVELGVLSGRAAKLKCAAAKVALDLVRAHILSRAGMSALQLTVEVRDMDSLTYQKTIFT